MRRIRNNYAFASVISSFHRRIGTGIPSAGFTLCRGYFLVVIADFGIGVINNNIGVRKLFRGRCMRSWDFGFLPHPRTKVAPCTSATLYTLGLSHSDRCSISRLAQSHLSICDNITIAAFANCRIFEQCYEGRAACTECRSSLDTCFQDAEEASSILAK